MDGLHADRRPGVVDLSCLNCGDPHADPCHGSVLEESGRDSFGILFWMHCEHRETFGTASRAGEVPRASRRTVPASVRGDARLPRPGFRDAIVGRGNSAANGGEMRRRLVSLGCATIFAYTFQAHAAVPFAGEWMLDAESCADARLVWTEDGQHRALTLEDGAWLTLLSVPYTLDGDIVRYRVTSPHPGDAEADAAPVVEALRWRLRGPNALTVENLARVPPGNRMDLIRCPPRGP
ncbi:MAG: hypothetical protein V2J02_21945 [Pseudomonadales bacterium]|nr:hypothetical protein [Pseudomonadales bacterium]